MNRIAMAAAAVMLGLAPWGSDAHAQRADAAADTILERSAVPSNYRDLVAADLKRSLIDPRSIRYAGISSVAFRPTGLFHGGRRATVCVRFDARDANGNYAGPTSMIYWFDGAGLGGSRKRQSFCRGAAYTAFPEAEWRGGGAAGASRMAQRSGLAVETAYASPRARVRAPREARAVEGVVTAYEPTVYLDDRRSDIWFRQR